MFMLKLIAGIAAIAVVVLGIKRFNQHCAGKFGHMFFTKRAFFLTVIALAFMVAGALWRQSALENHGDQLN